ncbi:hypothetical protein GN244_ATG08252 [Phytophthora infestans]|uniref:Uncharacterized protein n=1 Tax=Phytophthora infestans TaxID=4787 RepID=A0A833WF31_PHYIN|nr:hypothetical protein GN244_ATG08252 [Phytophthora infestans]KAF4138653.1 hypothetical protein GN958_ATG12158 [Phytophthora infestans]
MCKADISYLLNSSTTEDCAGFDNVVIPISPPLTSLFQILSPINQSPEPNSPLNSYPRRLISSNIAPRFKKTRVHSSDKVNYPVLSLAALYMSSEIFHPAAANLPAKSRHHKTHTPPCQVDGCKNFAVSRGHCVRHGGGSKCTMSGCNKRAKLYQRCFQHGGYKMCTEPCCTKKAKRYGHCWSHGGGHICEFPECTKVSTQVACAGPMEVAIAASTRVATVVRIRSTTTIANATSSLPLFTEATVLRSNF